MGMIFDRRDAGQMDDKTLNLTAAILEKNPDVNTMWNIRKECILIKAKEQEEE